MVHGLEAQYAGLINFYFLDADDQATNEWQGQLGFQYQPYFVLIDESGNVLKKWNGAVSQDEFVAAFDAATK